MKISTGDKVLIICNAYDALDNEYTRQAYVTKGSVGTVLSVGTSRLNPQVLSYRIMLDYVAPNMVFSDGGTYHRVGDEIELGEKFLELEKYT